MAGDIIQERDIRSRWKYPKEKHKDLFILGFIILIKILKYPRSNFGLPKLSLKTWVFLGGF